MITSFHQDEPSTITYLWGILLVIPILLAAGVLEQSGNHLALPDKESYRSSFSDTILGSSTWRKPTQPQIPWRPTTRPSFGWRTPPNTQTSNTITRRPIELFPQYQPGRNFDFNHITREEKPLIKVFEFGQ
ncbi:MAG: hypothetical protein ACPGYT_13260 [Nitrospirales bacterium]